MKCPLEARIISSACEKLVSPERENGLDGLLSSPGVRWPLIRKFLSYHDLAPFFYSLTRDNAAVPPDLARDLRASYYASLAKNELMWREFIRVNELFGGAQVMMAPIKGTAFLNTIYSGMPVRPMCDIDLLVREEDMGRVERLLVSQGYVKELEGLNEEYWLKDQCHIVYQLNQGRRHVILEVHFGLDFKRGYELLPRLWERSRESLIGEQKVRFLSPEDQVFSLVLHMRRFGRVLNLKNALDCALLLERTGADFDWEYTLEQARLGKMRSALFFLLHLAGRAGARVPSGALAGLRVPRYKRRLISGFVDRNLFSGRMDEKVKAVYTVSHFLLYDSFIEPFWYVLDIPHEQFCKYYGLQAYTKKSRLLFHARFLYIPLKAVTGNREHRPHGAH